MTVMPFPETRAVQRPRSNGAVCRAMPVWIPGILNAWSIQISATVARFRGNVRSLGSGGMPLIEEQRLVKETAKKYLSFKGSHFGRKNTFSLDFL